MVYSLLVTMDHPLADEFALNFNEMIRADGGRGIFPHDVNITSSIPRNPVLLIPMLCLLNKPDQDHHQRKKNPLNFQVPAVYRA